MRSSINLALDDGCGHRFQDITIIVCETRKPQAFLLIIVPFQLQISVDISGLVITTEEQEGS